MKPFLSNGILVAGALLFGSTLAISSATGTGATRTHSDKSSIKCGKTGGSYCFAVQNVSSGNAIEGEASSGNGLFGVSTGGVGVYGESATNYGLYGSSIYNDGISGYSADDSGVSAEDDNANYYALLANADASGGYPFGAFGVGGEFTVNSGGSGYFSGSVTALDGYYTAIRSRDAGQVAASVALAPRATIKDSGTARLLSGEGVVRLDP